MTVYAPVAPALTGNTATLRAAAAGDQISGVGRLLLLVTNGSGSAMTVTLEDFGTALPEGAPASTTFADLTVSIPAGTSKAIVVRDASRFRDSNGYINLTWSSTTTVTWQAFEVA